MANVRIKQHSETYACQVEKYIAYNCAGIGVSAGNDMIGQIYRNLIQIRLFE